MQDKRLLVVGGTGVISFAVVNEALKQGWKVTCINRGISHTQTLSPDVEQIISDYRNETLIREKLKGRIFDAVLDVLCYTEKDIEYSVSLFKDHCKQYLFFSSAEAYNKPKYADVIYNEDADLVNPLWSYSINKAKCEERLKELAEKVNLTYTIIRPAITYGNTRIPYGVMPGYGFHGTIIQRILNEKPIILWDEGKAIAQITRVEDFAVGLVGLLGNSKAYNQAFHICGDEAYTWKDVIDVLGQILGKQPKYVNLSSSDLAREMPNYKEQILGGRAISQHLDNSKLKEAVPEFKTNISLYEGVKKTVDYYRSNNYLLGIDFAFDAQWDRIAKKYGCSLPLKFIDYLGSSSLKEQLIYFCSYHQMTFILKVVRKLFK